MPRSLQAQMTRSGDLAAVGDQDFLKHVSGRMANRASPYSTGWPFSTSLLTMTPADLGLDLVHQLHGLDDAEHLAGLHRLADAHERRRAGRRALVKGADDGRFHRNEVSFGKVFRVGFLAGEAGALAPAVFGAACWPGTAIS